MYPGRFLYVKVDQNPFWRYTICDAINTCFQKSLEKIPHTGDKASLDQCRQQHRCHRRVDQGKISKKKKKLRGDFRPLPNKNVQMLDHFFSLLFPKNFKSLKILDMRLQEVGAKRPLNITSKVKKGEEKNFFLRGDFR